AKAGNACRSKNGLESDSKPFLLFDKNLRYTPPDFCRGIAMRRRSFILRAQRAFDLWRAFFHASRGEGILGVIDDDRLHVRKVEGLSEDVDDGIRSKAS